MTARKRNTGKTGGSCILGRFFAASHKDWQRRDAWMAGNRETTAEIIPKHQAKLGECFAQSEEGITTVVSENSLTN